MTLLDENVLLHIDISRDRSVGWYMGLFVAILTISRPFSDVKQSMLTIKG